MTRVNAMSRVSGRRKHVLDLRRRDKFSEEDIRYLLSYKPKDSFGIKDKSKICILKQILEGFSQFGS